MSETTEIMVPDLQASLLCDDVRQEINGKFILIGLFEGIAVPAYPAVFQRICLVNRWCCGRGTFKQKSRIIKPDGTTPLVEGKEVVVEFQNESVTATSVEFFINVKFEIPGMYWIEILLDGDIKIRYPLKATILNIQRPQQGAS